MGEGERKERPLSKALTLSSVIKTIEGDSSGAEQLSFEQQQEINLFIESMYLKYGPDPEEWNLFCPIPVNDFLRRAGEFFITKADQKFVIQGNEPIHLMKFTWFQVFRTIRGKK